MSHEVNAMRRGERLATFSAAFIDHLARQLDGSEFEEQAWPNQLDETPGRRRSYDTDLAEWQLARLRLNENALLVMEKAVQYRTALYVADQKTSARLGERYQPIWVVGAPRTGGSYLTAELIRAMGYDPLSTPALM